MIFILYIPVLVAFIIGMVQTPQLVAFVQTHIPTLDVSRYFTVDATTEDVVISYDTYTDEGLLLWYPNNIWNGDKLPYTPLLALGSLLIFAALIYGIRANVAAVQRSSPRTECIQVFFGPSFSTSQSVLKIVPSAPVDVGAATDQLEADGYETSNYGDAQDGFEDEDEDEYYESDRGNTVRRRLLEGLLPESPTLPRILDMVLWRPNRPAQSTEHEKEPQRKKTRRAGRKLTNARHKKRAELLALETDGDGNAMIPEEPQTTPPRRSTLLLGRSRYTDNSIEALTRTPPQTPQPADRACPSWPPEAPSPSKLPRLYPSSSTASDLQIESTCSANEVKKSEPVPPWSPPPTPAPREPTSPQNWRARRGRPMITEGGFRMIRHFLGVARKSAPKNDQPTIKSEELSPTKDDNSDKTLVEQPGSTSVKVTPLKGASSRQRGSTKSETKLANSAGGLFSRPARIVKRGLGLEEQTIVYNPCY